MRDRQIPLKLDAAQAWVLAALLMTLHLTTISPFGSVIQKGLLLAHIGFFLIWQPFVNRAVTLRWTGIVVVIGLTAGALLRWAPWMLVAWMTLLAGILGGKVATSTRRNWMFMLALIYLLAMLLLWTLPILLLGVTALPGLPVLATFYLPLIIPAIVFFKPTPQTESALFFDFFYAVLAFQLVVVLVLGSVALMRYTGDQYYSAVFLTVTSFGAALSLLALMWNPGRRFGGFVGLRMYFSRYLLSVGMPFEIWMRSIAGHAERERDPAEFLVSACREIAALPWVAAVVWRAPDGDGQRGEIEAAPASPATRAELNHQSLHLVLHTRVPLAPALQLHTRLLAQVVGEFYEAKRRERALRVNAYMQAVHQTGAELTHEVKNILQSMQTLVSAGSALEVTREAAFLTLLRRTLPQLAARLAATIERLRAPDVPETNQPLALTTWWDNLRARYGDTVAFEGQADATRAVPASVLDSIVDNLVQNARAKMGNASGGITVHLHNAAGAPCIRVIDSGSAMPARIARQILRSPIERSDGERFGIGLYQSARQAERVGWELRLAGNDEGAVVFELRPDPERATEAG
jgi:hypothetical protein